ncbi:hypothetical protein K501DRAFT_217995, partial [Backusella circina FSU 941]
MKSIDPYLSESDYVVDKLANLLEKYGTDMENLVKKRTSNLQQRTVELEEERGRTQTLLEDLEAAKDNAEAAATAKQNFLANMSHEIRTPMNAVIGMSRILMESHLTHDLHDCAETIENSGNHLMAIIDDILDYSKIEAGKLSLEKALLDMSFVVESAVKLVVPNFFDKGVVITYEIDPEIPVRLYGDIVRLRQIILNLLSNAYKFTQKGNVVVQVKMNSNDHGYLRRPSDTNYVSFLISVKDSGIGIEKDKIGSLFQSFSQVDASTTRNFGGTGLGLAISRQLCRMMGGDMWVESEYGVGTTFTCEVVLQKQAESPTYRIQNNLDELSENCKNVVVITDKKTSQKAWVSLLSSLEIRHVQAMDFSTFMQAYENLESKDDFPNLLIIDEDFAIMDDLSTQKRTSKQSLNELQMKFKCISQIPTLYISDIRSRSSSKSEASSDSIQHIRSSTNVTSEKCLSMCKPYKNSKLVAALHRLMDTQIGEPNETEEQQVSVGTLEQTTDSQHPKFLDQRSHSFSSTSSGRPLADYLSGIHSLLVDDNPINVKVMKRMLTRMGLNPLIAQNGREACDIVSESKEKGEPIDLIFMDIWMPEMNGFEAARHIRHNTAYSSLNPYIIAMTACVMPGDREKCLASGMNGYVSKPVRKEELEAALHTCTQIL